MTERTDQLRREWDRRSASMGSTQRAVLFKRFPGWLNDSIHRRHVRFIIDNCPPDPSRVLDVGCGYGRISAELARRHPATRFQGVDLSEYHDQGTGDGSIPPAFRNLYTELTAHGFELRPFEEAAVVTMDGEEMTGYDLVVDEKTGP